MKAWQLFIALLLLVALGCGGGGGTVAPVDVSLSGQIIWIETGTGTDPASTVRVGDVSAQTDLSDGFFFMDVPSGTTSLTVTYAGTTPVVRTFSFPALSGTTDLGELYIGPEAVTVTGTVLDSSTNQPVPGASVQIGGRTGTTNSSGVFNIPQVAYSSSSLAVFLGLQGTVEADNYFQGFFNPGSAASAGVVSVGNLLLTPEGSCTPPGLPFNLSGNLTPTVNGSNATVQAKQGAVVIRTVTASGLGNYQMWLPAGTYTIEATGGGLTGSQNVTINDVSDKVNLDITLN